MSQSLVQVVLGTISLGLLCAFGVAVQQPLFLETLPITQQESVPAPAFPPQPTARTDDFKNDPLFLEIQKMVQAGSTPSVATGPSNMTTDSTTDSISNSRWHAVESILAASRMLEQEAAECITRSDVEGAAKVQRAIRSLRAQAMELLH